MRRLLWLLIPYLLMAHTICDDKLFSLHTKGSIPFKAVLQDLVDQCNLSIVFKDTKSKNIFLSDNISYVNVKDVPFRDFLKVIFDKAKVFYHLKGNVLTISYYDTQTFKLDYIPTRITGQNGLNSDNNKITTDFRFDFWDKLEANIIKILKNVGNPSKATSALSYTTTRNYYPPVNQPPQHQYQTTSLVNGAPVIDKDAGLVTVTGTKAQLNAVRKYIEDLNKRLHKEVLIDVRIYSVTLSKSHATGIDWSKFNITMPDSSTPLKAKNIVGSYSIFKASTFNVAGLLNFLAQNGNVNSISNPKIVTLNNQKAIIKVGDTIYYKYASQETTNTANNNNAVPTVTYTMGNQFVGILLDITPQISDDGTIILSINPTISSFRDLTQLSSPTRTMPPDIHENNLISVVRLKDNETLVLGGLISNEDALKVNGVPVLKEIPILKYLFSSRERVTNKKELVFVITPHIINLNKRVTLKDYGYKQLPSLKDLDVK